LSFRRHFSVDVQWDGVFFRRSAKLHIRRGDIFQSPQHVADCSASHRQAARVRLAVFAVTRAPLESEPGRKPRRRRQRMCPKQSEVIEALRRAHGLIEPAAIMLGMSRSNLYQYIGIHSRVAAALKQITAGFVDHVEGRLYKKAVVDEDLNAMKMVLGAKGQDRGYGSNGAAGAAEATGAGLPSASSSKARRAAISSRKTGRTPISTWRGSRPSSTARVTRRSRRLALTKRLWANCRRAIGHHRRRARPSHQAPSPGARTYRLYQRAHRAHAGRDQCAQ
jgi:hypothetical protein